MSSQPFGAPEKTSFITLAPPPPTRLGRYRQLSPHAGVFVSPLTLGGMSIGDKWAKFGMGAMDKKTSFELLDAYYAAGGNFIDTACNYQDESSEEFIGEWMETRGIRPQMVIATKYTANYKRGDDTIAQKIQYYGNSIKAMRLSVDDSLRKLRTSFIDILYVHWWDYSSSIEEVMNGLHQLIMEGKVLYLGISDTPAWIVASANQYARDHGKTPFSIYQGQWNVLSRDFEREIIPMARAHGMALAPWDVLCSGKIRTDAEEELREKTGEQGRTLVAPDWKRNEVERKVSKVLEEIAQELGAKSIQAVAIAYLMQKTTHVFPIIGMRKVSQLHANIEALEIALTPEHIKRIESVKPFDLGFPQKIFGDGTAVSFMTSMVAQVDLQPPAQPIKPVPAQKQ